VNRRLAWDGLGNRVVSALVLAPVVLAGFYAGSPYSDMLILAAGGIAVWEWTRICRHMVWDGIVNLAIAVVLAALAAAATGFYAIAAWTIGAGALAVALAATRRGAADAGWLGLGVAYLALACVALIWLRNDLPQGGATVFWLLALVWATDIGAYFAGRFVGGPKLAPPISPNKTWAGLGGGMLAAGIVGLAAAGPLGAAPIALAAGSMVLAVVAQLGDLFESGLKRRYGVKDSSALIPGHGGLLDRIDGLLAVFLAYGGVRMVTGVTG